MSLSPYAALWLAPVGAGVVGGLAALHHLREGRYAAYGLSRLAALAAQEQLNRWLAVALVAGAAAWLFAGIFRRWIAPRLPAVRRRDRMLAFAAVSAPFVAVDLFLYGALLRDQMNADLFGFHLLVNGAIVLVGLAVAAIAPLRRRETAGDAGASLRRVFTACAAPYVVFDALLFVLYHARISAFTSPLQLMPGELIAAKATFDAALWLLWRRPALRGRFDRGVARWRVPLAVFGCTSLALVAGANVAALAQPAPPSRERPNLVFLVVDALRPDRLGAYGATPSPSPAIDALAAGGVLYENAHTNGASTKLAIPSLLTSLHPISHGVLDEASVLSDAALTITEILANDGYATRFYNGGNIYLHRRFNFGQGFERTFYRYGADAPEVVDAFLSDLSGLRNRPFFAYLHFMDVHTPYNRNPRSVAAWGGEDPALEPGGGGLASPSSELPEAGRVVLRRIYDAQIRETDEQIGRVLDALRTAGLRHDTYVVFTADHGEEFWEHERFGHAHTVYEELLHIPLVLAGPGLAPRRIATRVRIVDVFPTALELLGLPLPEGIEGVALPTGPGAGPDRPVFAMASVFGIAILGLLDGTDKVVTGPVELRSLSPEVLEAGELYDLASDPGEQHNLVAERGGRASALVKRLRQHVAAGGRLRGGAAEIDARTRKQLEALGYREEPASDE